MAGPHAVTIRAYQVGFGDCFLLTFHYKNGRSGRDRHILIDFGSTGAPKGFVGLEEVAKSIHEQCNGKLDAVVATHRHKDHISGFATQADGTGPGDIIRACNPKVVIQPWTEDPDAPKDAQVATTLSSDSRAFARALLDMHSVAQSVLDELPRFAALPDEDEEDGEDDDEHEGEAAVEAAMHDAAPTHKRMSPLVKRLTFMGENNLPNISAVQNLMSMGKQRFYVHAGSRSGLERLLPGVKVHVLGPPTLEQTKTILKERHRDESEFWHFQALASHQAARPAAGGLFPSAPVLQQPPTGSRWLLNRLKKIRGEQLREIVRILDKAMNNTSVILLFEVGRHKLLFPGDAQIENWQFALSQPKIRALLEDVTFYKVGHHGSLNATPKSLWNSFKRRSERDTPRRLRSVVSTMSGKHGDSRRSTEVPRKTLIEALDSESQLFSTQKLKVKDGPFWSETIRV